MNILAHNKSGVYEIRNTINEHRYIGSAVSIYARWRVHLHQLHNNKSHNAYLQKAWGLYGEDAFEFNILCVCDKSNLILYEQRFIDGLDPEYNILRTAGSSLGRKISQETLQKLRLASLGHIHTEEHRAKIGAAQVGTKRSEATKAKFRIVNKIRTPEAREKIRVAKLGNQWNKGRHHSQETKDKMSLSNTGKPHGKKGLSPWNKAMKYSQEIREKMSLVAKLAWARKREKDGADNSG